MKYLKNCNSCMANKGVKRISPAEPVYEGKYWQVEHIFPCRIKGWLVLLPKRHVGAIHDLSKEEMKEFGKILPILSKALYSLLKNEKEYVIQLAEAKGFNHVHFHIIAKPKNLPKQYVGTKIFGIVTRTKSLGKKEIIDFCELLSKELKKRIK